MRIKELRPGNLLKNKGVPVEIDARSLLNMESGESYGPIKISGTWLGIMGFKKDRETYYLQHFPFEITRIGQKWKPYIYIPHPERRARNIYIDYLPELTYLHEVQNLLFALTGAEPETRIK